MDINIPQQERVKIEDLKVDDKNPNRMTKEQIQSLKRVIKEIGFIIPIITNDSLLIADGHQRLRAAKELGMKEVPVIRLNVSEVTRVMIQQILNKLKGQHNPDLDLERFRFIYEEGNFERFRQFLPDIKNYEELLRKEKKSIDPDKFNVERAASNPKYVVSVGDIFEMGNHKLMCGDSTNKQHVETLMGDDKARCVVTDPPYGVSYSGSSTGKDWEVIKNDDLRGDSLYIFLAKAFSNIREFTIENPAVYCCYATINHKQFEDAFKHQGFRVKQILVWDKGHILGRSDYHWCHEPIMYVIKSDKGKDYNCEWFGDRTQRTVLENTWKDLKNLNKEQLLNIIEKIRDDSDVLRIKRDFGGNYVHPTQKPVDLPKRLLRNSSEVGEIIYEPFCGSGSTLIACEQTHRHCRAMELDPKYVSAIVERWEKLTGQTSKRIK